MLRTMRAVKSLTPALVTALAAIGCAQFDGEDAPCSLGVLRELERARLVQTDGEYARLTDAGWLAICGTADAAAPSRSGSDRAVVRTWRRTVVPQPLIPRWA